MSVSVQAKVSYPKYRQQDFADSVVLAANQQPVSRRNLLTPISFAIPIARNAISSGVSMSLSEIALSRGEFA